VAGHRRQPDGPRRPVLRELFTPDVDLIGTSDDWGASKPDPAFFERVAEVVPAEPDEMLYVGDRVDNDIRPAVAAGMQTALVHRGPWATIQWRTEEAEKLPTFRVESLLELPGLIAEFNELRALTVVDHPYSRSSRSRTHCSCWCGANARRTSRTRSMPMAYHVRSS
jgi:hypothetical protein